MPSVSIKTLQSQDSLSATSKPTRQKKSKKFYDKSYCLRHSFVFSPMKICVVGFLLACIPMALVNGFDVSSGDELNFKPTKYSSFDKNGTYNSELSYNTGGMQPLYQITHILMSYILGPDPLPEGYIEVENDEIVYGPKVENNQWGELILHNWPILLITVTVALLVVLMPLIGFCFCCCRCAGNCGGRSEPFDKKHDTCRRVCWGLLLIILVIGILFGVIVAFVTNFFAQSGIDRSTLTARQGSADTQVFLKHTSQQVDHILVTNYKEFYNNIEKVLTETGTFINVRLEQESMAVSFKYLSDFLVKMPEKKNLLEKMQNTTGKLRVAALQLSKGLQGVKRDLLAMLDKCKDQACQEVLNKNEIEQLDANNINFERLPNVSNIIEAMDRLISQDIASAGKQGRRELEILNQRLNSTIAQYIPQIMDSLKKAGERFQKSANEVHTELDHAASVIDRETKKHADAADIYLQEYAPYRFYAGIAVCCALLLILLCLMIALCCGVCGKRPGGYGDDCCNKGAGSRFLIIAVSLIFLTFSALLLFAYLHFVVGIFGHRVICVPMEDPQNENDELFALFDTKIDLNRVLYAEQTKSNGGSNNLPMFRISHAIADCKANKTIYNVLRIYNRFDISEIKDYLMQYNINGSLINLVQSIDLDDKQIVILSAEDKQRILELAKSPLREFDSKKFNNNLQDTITKHSFLETAKQLRDTEAKITSNDLTEVKGTLRNQAIHLEAYERELVIPMKGHIAELKRLASQLDKMMRYKDRTFEDSIPLLVDEIKRAETFLNQNGRSFVKNIANNLTYYFNNEIDKYLEMVKESIDKKIGLCQPLAQVYDATYIELCKRTLDPLNGFWVGVVWCAILFLPTLCIAVKLAGLYQKSDPYPGPLVESEYLYDAYSDRDQIPLENGPKNKRRKNKDNRRGRGEYYDAPMTTSAAGTSDARDMRYNDMAPKHWSDGPRYPNPNVVAASEYERPPPYYYAGAAAPPE